MFCTDFPDTFTVTLSHLFTQQLTMLYENVSMYMTTRWIICEKFWKFPPLLTFFISNTYKQCQTEIGKKIKQMLSNTLRLNFCYSKIICILHPRYHPKIIGDIPKNKQKNKCFCIHEILWLIRKKTKIKMKNRSYRYNINRPRSRHGHKYSE